MNHYKVGFLGLIISICVITGYVAYVTHSAPEPEAQTREPLTGPSFHSGSDILPKEIGNDELEHAKLEYVYSKQPEKERCRLEQPILWPKYYDQVEFKQIVCGGAFTFCFDYGKPRWVAKDYKNIDLNHFAGNCGKYLEKTESNYVLP